MGVGGVGEGQKIQIEAKMRKKTELFAIFSRIWKNWG